jgi:deoxyadenosine/deoxycytidine kinase
MLIERIKTIVHPKEDYSVTSQPTKKVLYLTGMMGAGKTTIAEAMFAKSNVLIIPEFLHPIPNFVLHTRSSDPVEQKVMAQLWTLNEHSEKNSLVDSAKGQIVVDRTWLDTIFYSTIYGRETTERVMEKIEQYKWHPGFYVSIITNPDIVKDRLMTRIDISNQLWEDSWRPFVTNLYSSVTDIATRAKIPLIDTSNLSLEETIKIVERMLEDN